MTNYGSPLRLRIWEVFVRRSTRKVEFVTWQSSPLNSIAIETSAKIRMPIESKMRPDLYRRWKRG